MDYVWFESVWSWILWVLQAGGLPKMTTAMSTDGWNCFRNAFKRRSKVTQMKYRIFCCPCGQIWSLISRLFLQVHHPNFYDLNLETNDVIVIIRLLCRQWSDPIQLVFFSIRCFSWAFWCRPPWFYYEFSLNVICIFLFQPHFSAANWKS